MTTDYVRPERRLTPIPNEQTTAFWTGGKDDQLLIYRCKSCGHFFHPPAPACFRCRSLDVAPEPVSGRGTVATFTVNVQPWLPFMPPPYIVALIDLEEESDVRVLTQIVGVDPQEIAIGDPVEVFFEHWSPEGGAEVWVPLFRPAGGAA